ncbi:hypothetical protein Tco_0821143 [Tanacetum coccineum]|uniref:Uncharacterized protein n=1 Tax=Tanacetum coccineum TaxID=301880 RepID=A0ABQ5AD47_9ASTR
MTNKPTGTAGRGQSIGWAAQPHGWESDETPAARLEGCARRLEYFWSENFFPFDLIIQGSHPNPLIANFEKRNKQGYKERALSIYGDIYPEWCLEFFLMMYFDKGVDRTKLMIEKCIWFRLCGVENVLTLLELVVLLGLYEEDELNHGLFSIHFTKLEVDDKIVHKLWVRSLVHRAGSKERCQKRDMWMMSALEESRGSPSFGGDHYGAHGDGYHASSIVPSSGYKIRGSSTGFHGDDFDPIVHSEDYMESNDDEMQD